MTMTDIAAKYERLVIQNLILENAVEMAMAYMNLGEVAKAQNMLQGALLDSQLSLSTALKGAAHGNAAA
ncbi:MAG: hypothetical protein ACRD20_20590 [Terriglobales bacterium]